MPSNFYTPDVLTLSRSLAIAIRAHDILSLQGPLLIELSGFWLMAASSMKAKGGGEKKIDQQKEERWLSHANRNASNNPLLNQRNVDVDLISEAGIENERGQKVSVSYDAPRKDS